LLVGISRGEIDPIIISSSLKVEIGARGIECADTTRREHACVSKKPRNAKVYGATVLPELERNSMEWECFCRNGRAAGKV